MRRNKYALRRVHAYIMHRVIVFLPYIKSRVYLQVILFRVVVTWSARDELTNNYYCRPPLQSGADRSSIATRFAPSKRSEKKIIVEVK